MKYLTLLTLLVVVTGCATNPSKAIVGTWQTEVGGFPMQVTYTPETVQIEGYEAVPYQMTETELVVDREGSQAKTVEFVSKNEMIQSDPVSGTSQTYTRIKN